MRFIKRIRSFVLMTVWASSITGFAQNFSITSDIQEQITEEAEEFIDDMPEGLQDRLADAVLHAIHGFTPEIDYLRNLTDTVNTKSKTVGFKDIKISDKLSARLYTGETTGDNVPLLIYFHGGGWCLGSINVSDKFCKELAGYGNINVISLEYPLAPENPYPGAIESCKDAVRDILTGKENLSIPVTDVNLGGDGAGGNLVLEIYSQLKEKEKIKSLVLYYPLLDSKNPIDPESKKKYGRGFGFDTRLRDAFLQAYQGAITDYNISIPTLIFSAGRDIIYKTTHSFAEGNEWVTEIIFEGALHGFITDGRQTTALTEAVRITDLFICNQ